DSLRCPGLRWPDSIMCRGAGGKAGDSSSVREGELPSARGLCGARDERRAPGARVGPSVVAARLRGGDDDGRLGGGWLDGERRLRPAAPPDGLGRETREDERRRGEQRRGADERG